jgi:prepilin-type N-terminal cleavage/methylation domain-containing protein
MSRDHCVSCSRRAFTLLELVVVLAIIGTLMALLLPAVQAVREATRRLQCQQNLKQIALALHSYHEACRSFPYGVNAAWGHSWSAHVLPFVEQTAVADLVPWSEAGWWRGTDRNSRMLQQLVRMQIPLFRCPSQGEPLTSDINEMSDRYVTNYLACAGGDATHDNLGPGGMGQSNGMFRAAQFNRNPQRPARLQSVADGTSQTLMISESSFIVNEEEGCWICDRFYLYHPNADSGDGSDFSEALGSTFYPINLQGQDEQQRESAFSSYHPAGVNGAFADGSTHFFHDSVDLAIWRAHGSMRQREVLAR